jgi:hypothetical protein
VEWRLCVCISGVADLGDVAWQSRDGAGLCRPGGVWPGRDGKCLWIPGLKGLSHRDHAVLRDGSLG